MRHALIGLAFIALTNAASSQTFPPAPRPEVATARDSRRDIAWIPYVLSTLAITISGVGFYFQWIYTRGAKVTLLNDGDSQNSAVRSWAALPKNVQNDFPAFEQLHPGYALVRLVVLNTGDRPGYLKIESASAEVPWPVTSPEERPRMSYYTYVLAPALAVTDKLVIVRNLRDVSEDTNIAVKLKLRAGGPVGRFQARLETQEYTCTLHVCLIPAKSAGVLPAASVDRS